MRRNKHTNSNNSIVCPPSRNPQKAATKFTSSETQQAFNLLNNFINDFDQCFICGFGINKKNAVSRVCCSFQICLDCLTRIKNQQEAIPENKFFCPFCLNELSTSILDKKSSNIRPRKGLINLSSFAKPANNIPDNKPDIDELFNDKEEDETFEELETIIKCEDYQTIAQRTSMLNGCQCQICGKGVIGNGNICKTKECQHAANNMCFEKLPCGHLCHGLKSERKSSHPPCILCGSGNPCVFCSEVFSPEPLTQVECGHYAHRKCFKTERNNKSLITCIKCSKLISTAANEELNIAHDFGRSTYINDIPWILNNMNFQTCDMNSRHFEEGRITYICGMKNDNIFSSNRMQFCPLCNSSKIPICPEAGHWKYMVYKCYMCCSIGIKRNIIETKRMINGKEVVEKKLHYFCQRCYEQYPFQLHLHPSLCFPNCIFAPHNDNRDLNIGKCQMCNRLFEMRAPLYDENDIEPMEEN